MPEIIFTQSAEDTLEPFIREFRSRVFLVSETNVEKLWLRGHPFFSRFPSVILPAGEENKQLTAVSQIWEFLSQHGADRKSLLLNLGGGMLTDLAGFAASTFKRGISFINIPTTLLAQVDASVGGKTGFNFLGLKNEIGTFSEPLAVILDPRFLTTLDRENFLSGFAEMIKHGLIADPDHLHDLQAFIADGSQPGQLPEIIRRSVSIKKRFVDQDPREKGIRKALNFGHTTGHAIESLAMELGAPRLHGYAVAWGMIAELFLSVGRCSFPAAKSEEIARWIREIYGPFPLSPQHFGELISLMEHDKKNEGGVINFTLLSSPGIIATDQSVEKEEIYNSLEYLHQI